MRISLFYLVNGYFKFKNLTDFSDSNFLGKKFFNSKSIFLFLLKLDHLTSLKLSFHKEKRRKRHPYHILSLIYPKMSSKLNKLPQKNAH